MNIQDRIVKAISAIQEAGCGLTREQLTGILLGQESDELCELELDQLQSFGICEGLEEEDWNGIIDAAIEHDLIKVKNQKLKTLSYTPQGKKFLKKPFAVNFGDDDDAQDYNGVEDSELAAAVRSASQIEHIEPAETQIKSERTRLQVRLIQAVDHKVALDDFAQDQNVEMDEVIDNLFTLRAHGMNLDIRYFLHEIVTDDEMEEFKESFDGQPIDMKTARAEWGDVYSEEELRLLQFALN